MTAVLLGMIMSVCTCLFHNMATLLSGLVSTHFATCSCQCSLSNFTPISFHMLKFSSAHTVLFIFLCIVPLPILRMLI